MMATDQGHYSPKNTPSYGYRNPNHKSVIYPYFSCRCWLWQLIFFNYVYKWCILTCSRLKIWKREVDIFWSEWCGRSEWDDVTGWRPNPEEYPPPLRYDINVSEMSNRVIYPYFVPLLVIFNDSMHSERDTRNLKWYLNVTWQVQE